MEVRKSLFGVICLVAFLVLAGTVVGVKHQQGSAAHRRDTDANLNCRRASERTALAAAYILNEGYDKAPKDSTLNEGFGAALVATIPVPPGEEADATVAEVVRVENRGARTVIYKLTDDAVAVQKAGCDHLFPPR